MDEITQISVSSHTEMVQIPVFTSPLCQLKIPLCSSEQHDTELSSRSCGTGSGALGHAQEGLDLSASGILITTPHEPTLHRK